MQKPAPVSLSAAIFHSSKIKKSENVKRALFLFIIIIVFIITKSISSNSTVLCIAIDYVDFYWPHIEPVSTYVVKGFASPQVIRISFLAIV